MLAASVIIVVAVLVVGVVLATRSGRTKAVPRPILGGLYSVIGDDAGSFGVIKVLAVAPEGVHVSMYKNKFAARPAQLVESSLEFGKITDPEPGGIMHVPLSNAAYARLSPVFIQQGTVTPSDLRACRSMARWWSVLAVSRRGKVWCEAGGAGS